MKRWWFLRLLKQTFLAWQRDNTSAYAAALAYYAIFSVAPLLIITIAIVGVYLGNASQGADMIYQHIAASAGDQVARFTQNLVTNAQRKASSIPAMVVSAGIILYGASAVFRHLQWSLNQIWEVTPQASLGIRALLQRRVMPFLLVVALGALFIISTIGATVLSVVAKLLERYIAIPALALRLSQFALSLFILTFLFAIILKVLPDTSVRWRSAFTGGLLTSALFSVGQILVNFYLTKAAAASAYGAVGAAIVFLLWVYYSALIFFFGAEFTHLWGRFIRTSQTRSYISPGTIPAKA